MDGWMEDEDEAAEGDGGSERGREREVGKREIEGERDEGMGKGGKPTPLHFPSLSPFLSFFLFLFLLPLQPSTQFQ